VVGQLFHFSADSVENAVAEVLPLLRELFPAARWEAVKRHRQQQWSPDEVETLLVDSFETPVPRPSNNQRQKRRYSGKKKRHTLKTPILTDQKGRILDIDSGHRGPPADVTIWNQTALPEALREQPKLGDKAYIGAEMAVRTATKKPKGGDLTEPQKAANKQLAQERMYVEHSIRRVKGYRILRDEYRLANGLFSMTVAAVVGLLQFADLLN